jgi:hypothetical protein
MHITLLDYYGDVPRKIVIKATTFTYTEYLWLHARARSKDTDNYQLHNMQDLTLAYQYAVVNIQVT